MRIETVVESKSVLFVPLFILLYASVAACVSCSCPSAPSPSSMRSYDAAVEDAKKSVPYARDFLRLFPEAYIGFSQYSGELGRPELHMETTLYGRYILTLQVPVTFDQSRTHVVDYAEPFCAIAEVVDVSGPMVTFDPNGYVELDKAEWATLVDSDGDFKAIGLSLTTDEPVRGLESVRPRR